MKMNFQFLPSGTDLGDALHGTYNAPLVALSLLLAVLASYVALELSSQIAVRRKTEDVKMWTLAGAIPMGFGIWAMHFVGMMAFKLPVPMAYDPILTAISVLPAIGASYLAISIISHEEIGPMQVILGGVFFGAGIGAMHYTGMIAMMTNAEMYYRIDFLLLSVVCAVVLAILALSAGSALKMFLPHASKVQESLVGAVAMGIAISSMHYIAMKATVYMPTTMAHNVNGGSVEFLAVVTAVISTFLGCAVAIVSELSPEGKEA